MDAQTKFEQAIAAAAAQKRQAIEIGATYNEADRTYQMAIAVAKADYRKVYPEIVQPSGVD